MKTMKVNGEKIKMIRESLGLSKEEVAVRAGVSSQAVFSWEQGNVNTFATLSKVADALGVSEKEILEME